MLSSLSFAIQKPDTFHTVNVSAKFLVEKLMGSFMTVSYVKQAWQKTSKKFLGGRGWWVGCQPCYKTCVPQVKRGFVKLCTCSSSAFKNFLILLVETNNWIISLVTIGNSVSGILSMLNSETDTNIFSAVKMFLS